MRWLNTWGAAGRLIGRDAVGGAHGSGSNSELAIFGRPTRCSDGMSYLEGMATACSAASGDARLEMLEMPTPVGGPVPTERCESCCSMASSEGMTLSESGADRRWAWWDRHQ